MLRVKVKQLYLLKNNLYLTHLQLKTILFLRLFAIFLFKTALLFKYIHSLLDITLSKRTVTLNTNLALFLSLTTYQVLKISLFIKSIKDFP